MVAQTAKLSSHSINFDVFLLILEASKNLCTWGTRSSWLNCALRDRKISLYRGSHYETPCLVSLCHNRLPCQAMRDEGHLSELGLYRGSHYKTPRLMSLCHNRLPCQAMRNECYLSELGLYRGSHCKTPRLMSLCHNTLPFQAM